MIRRVTVLIGLFSTNAVQLTLLHNNTSDDILSFIVLSLVALVFSFIFLFLDFYLDFTMAAIDACLFGLTMGWIAVVCIEGISKYAIFFGINIVLLTCLTSIDIVTEYNRMSIVSTISCVDDDSSRSSDNEEKLEAGTQDIALTFAENNPAIGTNGAVALRPRRRSSGLPLSDENGVAENLNFATVFDGFRVRLNRLPTARFAGPNSLNWDDFTKIEHRLDSSSCHICAAFWKTNPVVLKLIKAERVSSSVSMAEFETEACVLSRVQHPNIVRLHGSGNNPRPFLVLEVLAGGTLSHILGLRADANNRIRKKSFTYMETLTLARALASSLDYLHNRWHKDMHIIHRDLKPDNIGFSADGVLKLFDFGLCACVKAQNTRHDTYKMTGNTGTLRYMAPEVALGAPYNKTVDVYSFSVIMWQVFTGKIPFSSLGRKAFMDKVIVGRARPYLDSSWPQRFRSLLEKCWNHDKDKRPDIADVLNEIDTLILEAENDAKLNASSIDVLGDQMQRCGSRTSTIVSKSKVVISVITFILFVVACVHLSKASDDASSEDGHVDDDSALGVGLALLVIASIGFYALALVLVRILKQTYGAGALHFAGLERGSSVGSLNSTSFNPLSLEVTASSVNSRASRKMNSASTSSGVGDKRSTRNSQRYQGVKSNTSSANSSLSQIEMQNQISFTRKNSGGVNSKDTASLLQQSPAVSRASSFGPEQL